MLGKICSYSGAPCFADPNAPYCVGEGDDLPVCSTNPDGAFCGSKAACGGSYPYCVLAEDMEFGQCSASGAGAWCESDSDCPTGYSCTGTHYAFGEPFHSVCASSGEGGGSEAPVAYDCTDPNGNEGDIGCHSSGAGYYLIEHCERFDVDDPEESEFHGYIWGQYGGFYSDSECTVEVDPGE